MPLSSIGEEEHDEFPTGSIWFEMKDEAGERIRCLISESALNRFEPNMELHSSSRRAAFQKHRAAIEQIASKNYDEGISDSRSVLIREEHVPPL